MRYDVDWNIDGSIDSHQSRKSRRIRDIARVIKRKNKVNYVRFLAEMQFNGIRKKVAEGYVEVLKDLSLITLTDEYIVWNNTGRNKGGLR